MTTDIERALREAAARPGPAEPRSSSAACRAGRRARAWSTWPTRPSTRRSGPLTVASTPTRPGARGLRRVPPEDEVLEDLARRISPRVLEAPARLDGSAASSTSTSRAGARTSTCPSTGRSRRGFTRRVLQATARIPFGELGTYAEVAAAAGSPRAVRAAGNALGREPDADRGALPPRAAHRRRTGRLHGRGGAQGVPAAAGGAPALSRRPPTIGPHGEVAERLKELAC